MAKFVNFTSFRNKNLLNNYFLILIIFSLTQFQKINCGNCDSNSKIQDGSTCFNEIIRFKNGYRSGQFSVRKDGLLFIEYSSDRNRLFYSLKPNGRGTYSNDETNKEISMNNLYRSGSTPVFKRYESKNMLVSLSNDASQATQYIFSLSSYYGLTELHYFDNNGNNNHKTWVTTNFLGINEEHRYIFSYQFSLIEGYSNTYYAAYVQYQGTNDNNEDYSISYTLSRFKFHGMDNYEKIIKEFWDNYDNRIVSAFIMDNYKVLIVFFLRTNPATYKFRIHNLDTLEVSKEIEVKKIAYDDGSDNAFPGEGIFFKGIELRYEYAAIIYYTEKNNGKSLTFKILYIKSDFNFDVRMKKYINSYDFDTSITLNELYKISYNRLLFVSTIGRTKLVIMLFDTYDSNIWYDYLNIRTYKFEIKDYYFNKEFAVDFFNDFLMLTSTVSPSGGNDLSSILLFFSYPNGTDFYMNISPYVTDSDYYVPGNNLISYLLTKSSIDNNIFGYTLINEVKLILIPDEIIFYKQGSSVALTNGEKIDSNGVLKQNKNLIKYDRNYTLDYQFMAKGLSSYDAMYNQAHDKEKIINSGRPSKNYESEYSQKIYYGRVNRLTFRLCHEYCETCKELGNSNNNQKCLTCLPDYRYDYFNYFNIYPENCVPEGYFNDLGTNKKIVKCTTSNSKFYYNITDNNKRICFDEQKECPDTYAFLNVSTKQCLNYTPPSTTIPTTIVTTIPKIPTTILKIPTTVPKIPTTLPKIPTTIPKIPTTIPKIPTTIPKTPTTISKTPTTIPKTPTTIPKTPTTIPKSTVAIPKTPSTIPNTPTTIPKIQTTIVTSEPTTFIPLQTTIITSIPKLPITTLINIPSTIIKETPTTIKTTFPLIKTTLTEKIPTTILPTTNLNIPTTIPTTHAQPILTTIPKVIPTTLPEIIPSITYQDKCLNGTFITNLCSNISDEELYSRLRQEIFDKYRSEKAQIYAGNGEYAFRAGNTLDELKDFNNSNGFSLIDLGECEKKLKIANNIPLDLGLIILEKEKINNEPNGKDVEFNVYHPTTYEILNLSICENIFDLYVPLKLSEEQEKIYNELIEQGYNPFDLNDKFYREICTPYNSENGTDVLLDEREEFFYYPLAEQMVCQNNCQYSSYSLDTKYMKCECGKNRTRVTLDLKHLSKSNILQSFLSTFKSTNYKVMKCYNLVFNLKIFLKNFGSIITLLFFIIYIIFMIHYCRKDIHPLKVHISKILFNYSMNENLADYNKFAVKQFAKEKLDEKRRQSTKKITNKKINFPPKKQNPKKLTNSTGASRKKRDSKFAIFSKSSRTNLKKKATNNPKKPIKLEQTISKKTNSTEKKGLIIYESKNSINNLNNRIDTINKKEKILDNFELNNLDYDEACELDNRGFCRTYCSVLMREHLFFFTFFACKDYNLFYVKIERFLTLVCIEMTVNGLFFVHETMYGKYIEEEEFTFMQKIPQYLFTLIASHLIEVILCSMGMTDTHLYQIKALPKNEQNGEKVVNIIDRMKNKLICFYIFTFLLFLFNWYFISAFCAVYQNTQKIFLKDSGISFLTSMIDPFIIYGATTLFRYISLLGFCKKKLGCVYKISDLIPIF